MPCCVSCRWVAACELGASLVLQQYPSFSAEVPSVFCSSTARVLQQYRSFPAENPLIRAAYLVDPVDNTQYSPESPENPSATKALAASGRAAGISGAGILSSCNPEGGNYKVGGGGGVGGACACAHVGHARAYMCECVHVTC